MEAFVQNQVGLVIWEASIKWNVNVGFGIFTVCYQFCEWVRNRMLTEFVAVLWIIIVVFLTTTMLRVCFKTMKLIQTVKFTNIIMIAIGRIIRLSSLLWTFFRITINVELWIAVMLRTTFLLQTTIRLIIKNIPRVITILGTVGKVMFISKMNCKITTNDYYTENQKYSESYYYAGN